MAMYGQSKGVKMIDTYLVNIGWLLYGVGGSYERAAPLIELARARLRKVSNKRKRRRHLRAIKRLIRNGYN